MKSSRAPLASQRKRVVVVTETHRCRYFFLRCLLRELNGAGGGATFGLMKTLVDGIAIGGPRGQASASDAGSTISSADVDRMLMQTAASSSSVDLISLVSSDQSVNFEVCFVDAINAASSSAPASTPSSSSVGAGSSTSSNAALTLCAAAAALEAVLCDVDSRACVICFEGPDPTYGASSEKAVANQIVSTAESVLRLWHRQSRSSGSSASKHLNVSGGLKLLVAICSQSAGAPATVINIAPSSSVSLGLAGDYLSSPSSSSAMSRRRPDGLDDPSPSTPSASFVPLQKPPSAVFVFFAAWFDYVFRWTRLLLSVALFGVSQRVVSWTDRVTSVREAVQHIGNDCREIAGEFQQARTSVTFAGMCSLNLMVVGRSSSFELAGDSDFARFVKALL